MSRAAPRFTSPGPFHAHQLRSGDPYELSQGHAVYCSPTGGRGGRANLFGAAVLDTDPAVNEAGVDTGFTPETSTMRAPDVAVGNVPNKPGWVQGVPPLAVEFADTGQDENDLQTKINELLAGGTRFVWVVRLVGLRRVEVYEPGVEMRTVLSGHTLLAPGILKNPVLVDALYEREAAHEATLRNLLQRHGFESLEDVRAEGREEGREEGLRSALRRILSRRGITLSAQDEALIDASKDTATLERWIEAAVTATSAADVLR